MVVAMAIGRSSCVTVWHPLLLTPVGVLSDLSPGSAARGQLGHMLRVLVAAGGVCRRRAVLSLLGEDSGSAAGCGACSACSQQLADRRLRSHMRDLSAPARSLLEAALSAQQLGDPLRYVSTLRSGDWRKSLGASAAYALVSDLLCKGTLRLGSASTPAGWRFATLEADEAQAFGILRGHTAVQVSTHLDWDAGTVPRRGVKRPH